MRIDIVGLSLAETALVLLFGVFAALLAGKAEEGRVTQQVSTQREQITTLERNNADLKQRMAILLPKLRSSAFPSCAEVGKAQGWLFTATVRGRDTYDIGGDSLALASLLTLYSKQLRESDEGECRQRIRLYVGKGVSGAEYEYAMRRLGQYFYIGYLGEQTE